MPKAFDACYQQGGKIRTLPLKDGKYLHVCFLDGKSYAGEVKKKKKKK